MVIDDGVHEGFPGPRLVVLALGQVGCRSLVEFALLSSDVPVAAPIRDVAELGHVNVDQRAWMVVLVATQRLASDSVDPGEPVDPAPHQDRVHSRCLHPELARDLNRTEPVTPPHPHDLTHQGRRSLCGTSTWTRGPVHHSGGTFAAVTVGPLLGGPRSDHEHLGGSGIGPPVVDNEARETQTGDRGQSGISVGHEGLQVGSGELDSSTPQPGRLHLSGRLTAAYRDNLPGHHT